MYDRLKHVELNEGLETLGTDEYPGQNDYYSGVFESSAVEDVRLPATLKVIEYGAFAECASLKNI